MQGGTQILYHGCGPFGKGKDEEKAMNKCIFDMDAALTDAELAVEKGRLMSTALFEELNDAGSDYYKLNSWDANCTRADIVLDYIVRADEALKAVREQCNKLFEEQRENVENSSPVESSEALTYRATTIQLLDKLQDVKLLRAAYTFVKAMSEHN